MITINLLPKEMVQDKPKSKFQILSILGAAILVVISSALFVGIHFFALPARTAAIVKFTKIRDDSKKYEEDHQNIKDLKDKLDKYAEAVAKCKVQQIKISKKLSLLANIVTKQEIYWLKDLKIKPDTKTDKKAKGAVATGPQVIKYKWEAEGGCKEIALGKVLEIVDLFKEDEEFARDVENIPMFTPDETKISGPYEEKKYFKFNLVIYTRAVLTAPKAKEEQQGKTAQPQKKTGRLAGG